MRTLRNAITRALLAIALIATALALAPATGAQASVPNRWGYAFVDTTSGVPDLAHQAGTWPAGSVQVTPGAVGEVFVKFPLIGVASGGVVHVTAAVAAPVWCQVEKWWAPLPDEIVAVRCYKYGGSPVHVPFSIVFAESTGALRAPQAYGYVVWGGASIASQYNSALAVNGVTPTSTGVWTVTLPGLGSTGYAGGIQVTALNSSIPVRCKVGGWAPSAGLQKIQVRCHDVTDAPVNSGWTLSYQRERAITGAAIPPKNFGYTFDNSPGNPGPYAPVPPAVNYNSQGAVNTVQTAGTGLRLVMFPSVGVLQDDVQVTAFGPGPEFCNLLTLWATSGGSAIVRDVACYKGDERVGQPSMVSYVGRQ
ncbi:hypothetical protein [Microbispora sp. NPDC049125]|uniref:hypothetical protein n=1 Tax=Microbispora sp. NPDC049125 TaxID=3154929 RepID=UPI0034670FAA